MSSAHPYGIHSKDFYVLTIRSTDEPYLSLTYVVQIDDMSVSVRRPRD